MNSPQFRQLVWTGEDANALREFFRTPAGAKLQELIQVEPNSRPMDFGGRPTSAEYTLGMIEGYRMAVAVLATCTVPPPSEETLQQLSSTGSRAYPELPPETED